MVHEKGKRLRVAVGLSGGVDSAIAAAILLERGYDVLGVYIKLWSMRPVRWRHAKLVADKLGIPFKVLDLSQEFKSKVVDYFVRSYLNGYTPNPCVVCNRDIKFGLALKAVKDMGYEFFATGHYARLGYCNQRHRWYIAQAKDINKDQSYMLYMLPQEVLSQVIFPIGDIRKENVKRLARTFCLEGLHSPEESYDMCFAPGLSLSAVMYRLAGDRLKEGPIYDIWGKMVGYHKGIGLYTVGQRRGLKVSSGKPMYILAILPELNTLIVGPKDALEVSKFTVRDVHYMLLERGFRKLEAFVRVRLHTEPVKVLIVEETETLQVYPLENLQLVTPGQSAVFYDNEGRILMGGIIEKFEMKRKEYSEALSELIRSLKRSKLGSAER